jgi:hypothetical protein
MQCDIQLASEKVQAPEQLKSAVAKLLHAHASPEAVKKAAALTSPGAEGAGEAAGPAADVQQRCVGQSRWKPFNADMPRVRLTRRTHAPLALLRRFP